MKMKNNKGFTLIELMITISIFSMVIGYYTLFFRNEINLYYSKGNSIELGQDARIALDRIVTKIRNYNGLTFQPGINGTGVIYNGSQVLINTMPNDPNGDINFSYDTFKGYGEIRDKMGYRIVNYIKNFRIDFQDIPGTSGLVTITITCGNDQSSSTKQYSISVRLSD